MKKEKVNSRLKNLIEKDRLLLSKDVLELIQFDLYNLLNNYFNLSSSVNIEIQTLKDRYELTIKTTASGVKPFGVIK